jgi:hypothetical protein
MKSLAPLLALTALSSVAWASSDEVFDGIRDALSYSSHDNQVRARLSGTLDLEEYWFQQPAPQLIYAEKSPLFTPRLTLFLDAQVGDRVYVFVQGRADRGFDPSDEKLEARLDEYALRYTAIANGALQIQIGKFGAVVGNWIRRHGSWDDPFISAPMAYTQLTGVWDVAPAVNADELLEWAHLTRDADGADEYSDKGLELPIIWGPSYAHGISISGEIGKIEYAVEMKSGSLSSRPEAWDADASDWKHPTFNAELSYHPSPMWNVGISASSGPYLLPSATSELAPKHGLASYRETVFGADFEFAWRHWQVWAEVYRARFENPWVGDADVTSYYVEAKYKFAPQFFAALRWNQDSFGRVFTQSHGWAKWGLDSWRLDFAPTYRFTTHIQAKLQYSLQHRATLDEAYSHLVAVQLTTRF